MITGINGSKILTKHVSCECKCKFDDRKCNSNQKWNNNKVRCSIKIIIIYARSMIDNLVATCDEIIEKTKTITKNQILMEKR